MGLYKEANAFTQEGKFALYLVSDLYCTCMSSFFLFLFLLCTVVFYTSDCSCTPACSTGVMQLTLSMLLWRYLAPPRFSLAQRKSAGPWKSDGLRRSGGRWGHPGRRNCGGQTFPPSVRKSCEILPPY